MALIERQIRKAITTQARKLVKKHGQAVAVKLVTNIVANIVTGDDGQATEKMRKKLKKAQKNGNFVSEAAVGLMSNLVSNVITSKSSKGKKKAKHNHHDSEDKE